jgi:DNA-binding transcriptional ArsR family regulator
MPEPAVESDVFLALASPVRRGLLERLSSRDQSVRTLAKPFQMSQAAVSQHLAILRRAGLVTVRRAGRFRVYRLNAEPLRQVSQWVQNYERFWIARLKVLGEDPRKASPPDVERWR